MKLFVYEFVAGGGFLHDLDRPLPPASLLAEGIAMLTALAADFAKLPETDVSVLRDHRFELAAPNCHVTTVASAAAEHDAFCRLAEQADWTVVIAPEFDGLLHARCESVQRVGGRLLGPTLQQVALAADKQQMADLLARHQVPVTNGCQIDVGQRLPDEFTYPAVLKRLDGAGSLDIQSVDDRQAAAAVGTVEFPARLERFAPGMAASAAVLCGPNQRLSLAPCRQYIADDDVFTYLGGSLPLAPELADRAGALAAAAVAALGVRCGYVGVDLVLGDASEKDVVIEVNPRLSTSYVGLRAAYRQNLAGAMIDLAAGRPVELSGNVETVQFAADGTIVQ